jgi:hypothetical protein
MAAVLAAVIFAILIAPTWLRILAGLAAVVAWAVWATRPTDVPLRRHVAALVGQLVLDAVRAVARTVAAVLVVLALLWAGWSWIQPQLAAQLDRWRADAVQTARDAVPHPTLPDLSGLTRWLTGGGDR